MSSLTFSNVDTNSFTTASEEEFEIDFKSYALKNIEPRQTLLGKRSRP